MTGRLAAALLVASCAVGCVAMPPRDPATAACRAYFERLDGAVDAAGARDGGSHRIAGHPYLRADRFSASFRDEVDAPAKFAAWLARLQAVDRAARRAELTNLGVADVETELAAVSRCGDELAGLELAGPEARQALRAAVQVPDDYSRGARILGLYWLTVPFLRQGIAAYHDRVRADYAGPLDAPPRRDALVTWSVRSAVELAPREIEQWLTRRDALGIPQLDPAQWRALALAHAPTWWIEENGEFDRPGVPSPGSPPAVDTSRAVTYYLPAMTRFGDRVLAQVVYFVWFSQRPPQRPGDPYAGALDGVLWRVTLDEQGRPLVYDSIHSCGCYHHVFAAQPLQRRPLEDFWREPALFPQTEVPAGPRPALRLQSGTHDLRRVVAPAAAQAQSERHYELRTYTDLLTLDAGQGHRRSLFGADGLVRGSERRERYWLWVSGVVEPGAMRQWGRHAIAFVGRRHFDDARFLEEFFVPPR